MAEVKEVELTVPQGTTYKYQLEVRDRLTNTLIDMSAPGWLSRLQIRERVDSTTTIYSGTEASGITLGNGSALWTVTHAVTAAWSFKKAVFDWEVESPSGEVSRLVKGTITLDPEVTR